MKNGWIEGRPGFKMTFRFKIGEFIEFSRNHHGSSGKKGVPSQHYKRVMFHFHDASRGYLSE